MPEGDTVHRSAARLHDALAGRVLTAGELRWPSLAGRDLRGWSTSEVRARGKHLLHRFDSGWTLHSHLRMEGQWRIEASGPRASRVARRTDVRALLATEPWSAFGLRLGLLELVRTRDEGDVVGHLGPDILGPDWDLGRVLGHLHDHPGMLVEALLDQRVLAGVGTFWASEGLFLARLSPWDAATSVAAETIAAMLDRVQTLMSSSARSGWQVSTGIRRSGDEAYVHARSGRACRRCGRGVRVALAGRPPVSRTIFYCPHCQGGLGPTDDGRPQRPLGSTPRTSPTTRH